jgi:hypothetical protein
MARVMCVRCKLKNVKSIIGDALLSDSNELCFRGIFVFSYFEITKIHFHYNLLDINSYVNDEVFFLISHRL